MMINRLFDRGTYHALREYNVYIYIYTRARVCYLFERDECSFTRSNILY